MQSNYAAAGSSPQCNVAVRQSPPLVGRAIHLATAHSLCAPVSEPSKRTRNCRVSRLLFAKPSDRLPKLCSVDVILITGSRGRRPGRPVRARLLPHEKGTDAGGALWDMSSPSIELAGSDVRLYA